MAENTFKNHIVDDHNLNHIKKFNVNHHLVKSSADDKITPILELDYSPSGFQVTDLEAVVDFIASYISSKADYTFDTNIIFIDGNKNYYCVLFDQGVFKAIETLPDDTYSNSEKIIEQSVPFFELLRSQYC